MKHITTSDGTSLYVKDRGVGRPVFFRHGRPVRPRPARARPLRPVVRSLARHGTDRVATTVLLDYVKEIQP